MKKLIPILLALLLATAVQPCLVSCAKPKYDALTAMSFNIRLETKADRGERAWAERRPNVKSLVDEKDCDIVCFQEVKETQYADLREDYGEKYEIYWHGRDKSDNPEGLAVLWRKGMFDELSRETFWLSETPEKMSLGWGATFHRICVSATLKLRNAKNTGATVTVYNVHLDHIAWRAQTNGMALIRRKAAENPSKAIIMGDFNCNEECILSNAWKRSLDDFNDCRLTAEESEEKIPTYNNFDCEYNIIQKAVQTSPIDHCLIEKDILAKKFDIVTERPKKGLYSDHNALVMTLRIPQSKKSKN